MIPRPPVARRPSGRSWSPWLIATAFAAPALALAQAGGTAGAPPPAAAAPAPATPSSPASNALDCMIQPQQVVVVGVAVPGVVEHIGVDRGDRVAAGQVVARQSSQVERAALALARARAEQRGESSAAQGSAELARRDLQRTQELYQQQFVSQNYLDRQHAEARVADGRRDQAEERRALAAREVDLAAAQLAQRTIRAPVGGVVIDRLASPGEYVDQKPLLRIATIDPLRVDVLVPAVAFGRLQPGMSGTVWPELLDRGQYEAVVKTVDGVIDAATNTFRVRLELPNPGGRLPAGLRCRVDLALGADVLPAATPAAPGAARPIPTRTPVSQRGGVIPIGAQPLAALR